ncbi:MAG: glycosyltransferase family 39 protein [Candidatus Coatesbacteria bacterium]|nr:MAG: glycosyltransferase family 39 protein [Candidatus Coatesbacteria bacterium]
MNRVSKGLFAIAVFAVALRIFAVFFVSDYVEPNAWEYGAIAENIRTGKGYSFNWYEDEEPILTSLQGPFYVYFLVAAYSLPYKFLAIQLFQSLVWGINCLLVYCVIRELGEDERVALLAAAGVAVYPALVFSATQLHHTTFSFALITGALCAFARARRTASYRAAASAGVLLGLYALNEPVVFAFLPLGLLWFIWRRKRNVPAATFVMVATVLTILPWSVRNYYVHQHPCLVKSSIWQVLWIGNNPAATGSLRTGRGSSIFYNEMPAELTERIKNAPTEIERSAILRKTALRYIKENPGRVLATDLKKVAHLWWFDPYHPRERNPLSWVPWQTLFLLGGAGLILKARDVRKYLPVFFLFIGYGSAYAIFVPSPRYKFVFIPYFLALAAVTITTAVRDFKVFLERKRKP